MVTWTAPFGATDRFARIIDGLCQSVAASHSRGVAGPLILLLWGRLRRMAARFAAAAQVGSGRRPASRSPAAVRPYAHHARPQLPGGFGWVVRLVPGAACRGSQLQHLLADPEMAALLAAAPQIGRILRPLCRMLAIEPPPGLRAPPRRRVSAARTVAAGEAAASGPSPAPLPRGRRRDPLHRPPCDLWLGSPRFARGDGGGKDASPADAVGMSPLVPT